MVAVQHEQAIKLDQERNRNLLKAENKPDETGEKDESAPQEEQIAAAAEEVETLSETVINNYSIEMDSELNRRFVVIKDPESEEVIRKIPSEEIARMVASFAEDRTDAEPGGEVDVRY